MVMALGGGAAAQAEKPRADREPRRDDLAPLPVHRLLRRVTQDTATGRWRAT